MWESILRRRSRSQLENDTQCIELSEDDCKLLLAAGLKIQKGTSPRDLYCFQYLPSYYDGTPLQVLRLLEEVRNAGRLVRAEMEAKRQRLHGEFSSDLTGQSVRRMSKKIDIDVELLEQDDAQMPEMIKVVPKKLISSPVKSYSGRTTPVKRMNSPAKSGFAQAATPVSRGTKRTSMTVNVVESYEEVTSAPASARKRKSESTSPLAALFSPRKSIETPSPGLKTRRTSVLKQFETPDAVTDTDTTPQTAPATPKRFSQTEDFSSITKKLTQEWEGELSDDSHDELDDDGVDDDSRACCADVKSVVEPVWDVLQRTSSRFQNVWEEVRALSSSLLLVPVSDEDEDTDDESRVPIADVRVDDAVDLLVYEGDEVSESVDPWANTSGLSVRTRRQRQEIRRLSGNSAVWRLW